MTATRLLVSLCIALQLLSAWAWGPFAHDYIATVASNALQKRDRIRIKKLLEGDLTSFDKWEQEMTSKYPATASMHWHRQIPNWNCGAATWDFAHGKYLTCDESTDSMFCAMVYFFEHFADDSLLKEFPAYPEPLKSPTRPQAVEGTEQTAAHYLRWLVILIGDIHQPLKLQDLNNYGKNRLLTYQGKQYTLYHFFEEYLTGELDGGSTQRLVSAKKQKEIDAKRKKDKKEYESNAPAWWDKAPQQLFREWSNESAGKLCSDIYATIGGASTDVPFEVTHRIYDQWLALVRERAQIAGLRLAYILHDILEHTSTLHKTKDDGRKKGHKHLSRKHGSASGDFRTNLGYAAVVVPLLLLVLMWHREVGVNLMVAAHHKM